MAISVHQDPIVKEIDTDALRRWLEDQRPVTIVDVRADEDWAQWAIPGSLHVSAFDALRNGWSGGLSDVPLPRDRPVVTVCNAGRTSRIAAAVLARRGLDVLSLTGGMKAWSLAWNTADVPLEDSSIQVVQVRRTGKGCLSYIVASNGEAAVIDPSVAPEVYLDIAMRRGWSIRSVLDTHVHADHLSRGRQLSGLTDATLVLPRQERVAFAFTPIADGQRLHVGNATLAALHTPGHTSESTSFVLNDVAVFTGDTLFTNGVGRPDLHAGPEEARARARALFASLERLRLLPPDAVVLPGHASEPIAFDEVPVAARLREINRWLTGWVTSESAFVDRVTSHLPPTPPNFARIVQLNEADAQPPTDPIDLEAGANRCAVS